MRTQARQAALLALGLALSVASAWAMGAFYSSGTAGLAVSQVTGYTNFVNNQTGGASEAFTARVVTICNTCATHSGGACGSASTKFVYYHLSPALAASATSTLDLPLPPLGCDVRTFSAELGGSGWASIAYIADAGNTASIDVTASK